MSRVRIVLASISLIGIVGAFVAYRYIAPNPVERRGWARYFFPPSAKYSCSLATRPSVSTVGTTTITATGHLTYTVVGVRSTTGSISYMLRVFSYASSTETNPPEGASSTPPISQTFLLNYKVLANGRLLAPEQSFHVDGVDANVSGFIVYPSVTSLNDGDSFTSSLHGSVSSSNSTYASELASVTTDHSPTVRFKLLFRVVGVPTRRIVTPGGTFTKDVGVKVSLLHMTITNVAHGKGINSGLELVWKTLFPTTVYYWARGVGLVDVTSQGPFGNQLLLEHCTSSRSASR
jgi:hypothetical protein